MKKLFMMAAAMAAMVGFAGQDDLLVTISSEKQLYYNNETLINGDIVALVWTPTGGSFGGFLADGTIKGDSKVLARMVVKDGKFPTTTFQISAKLAEEMKLAQGTFALYLLDTRAANGTAQGVVAGDDAKQIVPVNYYAEIVSGEVAGSAVGAVASIGEPANEETTVVARGQAQLPLTETELKPIIKSVKVEDGKFKVTIENAVPYLKYGLMGGETPSEINQPISEAVTPKTATVELEVPTTAPSAIIKVTADRNM